MKIKITTEAGSSTSIKTGNWRSGRFPAVDKEKCIGCANCDRICPEGVCIPSGKKNKAGKIYYECDLNYCKGCSLCAEICPVRAISMIEEEK